MKYLLSKTKNLVENQTEKKPILVAEKIKYKPFRGSKQKRPNILAPQEVFSARHISNENLCIGQFKTI